MFEDPSAAYLSLDTAALQRMIEDRQAASRQLEQQILALPDGSAEIPSLKDRLWTVKAELLEMTYAMDLKNSSYTRESSLPSEWQRA